MPENKPSEAVVVLFIGAALFALTTLTLLLSHAHLSRFAVPVALTIASAKAALIGLYFMRLRERRRGVLVIACVAIFFVVLLVLGAAGEASMRVEEQPLPRNLTPGRGAPASQ